MSNENPIGARIGTYHILREVGRGGNAVVYLANDEKLERPVAVKMLHAFAYHPQRERIVERFRRGAQAAARLHHPNILPVYDFGEWQKAFYIAMQYVPGKTLQQVLLGDSKKMRSAEPLPLSETLNVAQQVGAALAHARRHGVTHRDVKPSNILIDDDGHIYLTDFGLAQMEGAAPITQTGETLGTPHYMSPEQGRGLPADHRSDIYSLGVVLFQMLTGQVPFDADTPAPVILKHMVDPLPPPRSINPEIPPQVEAVLCKALAKNPSQRYQTVEQFTHDLAEAVAGSEAKAVEPAAAAGVDARPEHVDVSQVDVRETPTLAPHDRARKVTERPPHAETRVSTPAGPAEPPPRASVPGQAEPAPLAAGPSAPPVDRTAEWQGYKKDTGPLSPVNVSRRTDRMRWVIAGLIMAGLVGLLLVCSTAIFFLLGGPDLLRRPTSTVARQVAVTPSPSPTPTLSTPSPTPAPPTATSASAQTETAVPAETNTLEVTATSTPTVVPAASDTLPPTFTTEPTVTPTLTPTSTPTPTVTPTSPPPVPAGMVLIPAGDFIQGSSDAEIETAIKMCATAFDGSCPHPRDWFTDETPRRTVTLDAFYVDKWEVTNEQFSAFADASGYLTDAEKKGEAQNWRTLNTPGRESHPVVWMSWNDANAYCQWAGKRLPTEAEWEKAARGSDGRIWPWGSNWEAGRANSRDGGAGSVVAVGSYPRSASPYGVMDMCGNVWEWVADWYDPLWYNSSPRYNPSGPMSGVGRVLRGGGFRNPPWEVRAVHRHSGGPDGYAPDHGFRCVK